MASQWGKLSTALRLPFGDSLSFKVFLEGEQTLLALDMSRGDICKKA